MRKYISSVAVLAVSILLGASFVSVASATDGQKMAFMQLPQIQSPISPLTTNIAYYVRTDHHGRKKYCNHRHCRHWHRGHDHHGNHIRRCTRWHYTECRWVNPHHHH